MGSYKQELNELCDKVGWNFELSTRCDGTPQNPIYASEVRICGRGIACCRSTSKSEANAEACKQARSRIRTEPVSEQGDAIAALVVDAFNHCTTDDQQSKFRKGVLAGIVMEIAPGQMEVVSLGAGTSHRSPSQEDKIRPSSRIFDCHAEILARRGFLCYLMQEMEILNRTGRSEVLSLDGRGHRVRSGIRFHLYISSLPCGDASCCLGGGGERNWDAFVVDVGESHQSSNQRLHWPSRAPRRSQGKLRAKMSVGESLSVLGADGEEGDARLCKMCCSDKLMRWNVLGVQGALLSSIMAPLYLYSVTIGDRAGYSHSSLARAVCCRASSLEGRLPPPFRVNHPLLLRSSISLDMPAHAERHSAAGYAGWWTKGREGEGEGERLQVFVVEAAAIVSEACEAAGGGGKVANRRSSTVKEGEMNGAAASGGSNLKAGPSDSEADPTSALHQFAQSKRLGQPVWEHLSQSGPPHAPVHIGRWSLAISGDVEDATSDASGPVAATGQGVSKQKAKAEAAMALLRLLRLRHAPAASLVAPATASPAAPANLNGTDPESRAPVALEGPGLPVTKRVTPPPGCTPQLDGSPIVPGPGEAASPGPVPMSTDPLANDATAVHCDKRCKIDPGSPQALAKVDPMAFGGGEEFQVESLLVSNPTSALYERARQFGLGNPVWKDERRVGPAHAPRWYGRMCIEGHEELTTEGEGADIASAKAAAARQLLLRLDDVVPCSNEYQAISQHALWTRFRALTHALGGGGWGGGGESVWGGGGALGSILRGGGVVGEGRGGVWDADFERCKRGSSAFESSQKALLEMIKEEWKQQWLHRRGMDCKRE